MDKLAARSTDTSGVLTGAKFFGNCDELGMQNYGLYVYPDGTKYLGQFHNNRFHGNGTIQLPHPYCLYFSVLHQHGKLLHIFRISFSDMLQVQFKITDQGLSFKDWNYCTAEDRRFNAERLVDMGEMGSVTEQESQKRLCRNIFDLGFGELTDKGMLKNIPPHISESHSVYVGCRKMRRWIRENCRHGPLKGKHLKQEVLAKFARQIIRNNLESAQELTSHPVRSMVQNTAHKYRVCRRSRSAESSSSAKEVRLHVALTSMSCSSLMDHTVKHGPQYKRVSTRNYPIRRSKTEENVCRLN
ncbi:uncharacterized protein LOC6582280 [Drosophila mojavensis]|uniref:MORN repeat-containing protein 5 n=1 Tax=Drosophila mojavensis TaxID=7230 RepID=B4KVT5_DROMO|nr:uncharacterized protein LOC6582280 [Drosophila mojavensis]EDW18459.1 uncharacterized protein Dmoj_GI13250 [Drosophila mojavensis]